MLLGARHSVALMFGPQAFRPLLIMSGRDARGPNHEMTLRP
jgi:hypothetical protein